MSTKLLFSIPTGYHLRELVMPLHEHLERDETIEKIYCITPGAPYRQQIFPAYSNKFEFYKNPDDDVGHRKLIQQLDPDIVITNTVGHDELDYPILKASQDLGVKSLTFIASWDNVWKIERLVRKNLPVCLANHIIVWNQMMHDHMLRIFSKLKETHISIIGAPRLDYFWHEDNIPSKEDLYSYLGFDDTSRPLIHFATTELYPMDYVAEAVYDAMKDGTISSNSYLYASVHPGGDMNNHRALQEIGITTRYSFGRQDNPPTPEFAYNASLGDIYMHIALFKHADVLINQSSTTALESLIGNTPVINVKYGKPFDWWRWYRSMVHRDFKQHYRDLVADGATYIVKSKHQLIDAVNQALSDPHEKEDARVLTIKRLITTTDGTAGQKAMAVIKDMAQG